MDGAYLEVYSLTNLCLAPIETIVTLFTIRYCDSKINIKLIRSKKKAKESAYAIDISQFVYEIIEEDKIPTYIAACQFPSLVLSEISCIAGLCAVLRQIVKETVTDQPLHYCSPLLGFKGSCLLACSETSVWTKFCEVDIISTLKSVHKNTAELPCSLARFECHMSQPVRIHNLYKYVTLKKEDIAKDSIEECKSRLPEHTYAEGSYITIADLIIFVCVHILFSIFSGDVISTLLPLTTKWYKRMIQDERVIKCLNCLPIHETDSSEVIDYVLPSVPNESLYKSDLKRYRGKGRTYTKQGDVDYCLEVIRKAKLQTQLDEEPYGVEIDFSWIDVPYNATPDGGLLPLTRLKRKYEQLQNLCKPVIKLAKAGDVIVDFCSGSGHLGILLAHLLPDCTVVLLENKEQSLKRAEKRVEALQLTNVKFYQCNLDYFRGNFDIGTSLHACGVATDLVIRQCIEKNAVFIACPCCYGAVQDCHRLTYPRSNAFKNKIDNKGYLTLSHAADQTHDKWNVKTQQGYECMAIIDTDRKLHAEQFSYRVHLAKLVPETCTSKNHMLVGIPKNRANALSEEESTKVNGIR